MSLLERAGWCHTPTCRCLHPGSSRCTPLRSLMPAASVGGPQSSEPSRVILDNPRVPNQATPTPAVSIPTYQLMTCLALPSSACALPLPACAPASFACPTAIVGCQPTPTTTPTCASTAEHGWALPRLHQASTRHRRVQRVCAQAASAAEHAPLAQHRGR